MNLRKLISCHHRQAVLNFKKLTNIQTHIAATMILMEPEVRKKKRIIKAIWIPKKKMILGEGRVRCVMTPTTATQSVATSTKMATSKKRLPNSQQSKLISLISVTKRKSIYSKQQEISLRLVVSTLISARQSLRSRNQFRIPELLTFTLVGMLAIMARLNNSKMELTC